MKLGSDRSKWAWGQLSTIRFEHPMSRLGSSFIRAEMNIGPEPKSGDENVVGMAAHSAQDFRVWAGASFRMVLDVGDWDNSVAVNSPGQSGDPESSHYRDLFSMWLAGGYFPFVYTRPAVERLASKRILLEPG